MSDPSKTSSYPQLQVPYPKQDLQQSLHNRQLKRKRPYIAYDTDRNSDTLQAKPPPWTVFFPNFHISSSLLDLPPNLLPILLQRPQIPHDLIQICIFREIEMYLPTRPSERIVLFHIFQCFFKITLDLLGLSFHGVKMATTLLDRIDQVLRGLEDALFEGLLLINWDASRSEKWDYL